ncbi:hypothetical protein ACGFMK_39825 [Amycolatopsis sp. NPDC049252]|uniref:hypothetical protein n=1 Tax=Amycolatopsis sp. NPDC049252 TaxID=3363933 RepID=UPI00371BAEB4
MFKRIASALAGAVVVLATATTPASAAAIARPVDLGTLPGGSTSEGLRVNYHGTVFGTAYDPAFNVHGARWDAAGRVSDLRPADGYTAVEAAALNEAGVAVGNSTNHVLTGRATVWDASGVPVLLPLSDEFPHHPYSAATALNEHGMVAGFVYGAPGPDTVVRWDTGRGTVTELGFGRAVAINEAGAVISRNTYWDPAGHVVEPAEGGSLYDLDDAGTVVGESGGHAAKWDSAGHLTVLDTTWASSTAMAITADGTIFGEVTDKDHQTRVARWDRTGIVTVLPTPGDVPSRFTGASRTGVALGQTDTGTSFTWDTAGRVSVLPPLAENAICFAEGLTDWAVTGSCDVPGSNFHAVLWKLGEPTGSRAP